MPWWGLLPISHHGRENGQAHGNHALVQIMIKIFEYKIYLEIGENSKPIGHSEQTL